MQRSTQKTSVPTKDVTVTLGSRWQFLLHWRRGAKTVRSDLDQQQNWLLSVPSCQFVTTHKSTQNPVMSNERCGRDVGHQMANFCYTGVAVQKRLAVTSISSRTGCCLCRLHHLYSAWRGKSAIMQRSTQKPFVPTTDVTVRLGI